MKQVYFLTPFPEIVKAVVTESILGRAEKKGLVQFNIKNLFDFSDPPHHRIDDYPFGGGAGMILKPEPVFRVIDAIKAKSWSGDNNHILFPTPDGKLFLQTDAGKLAKSEKLVFICGHYKGLDQRVRDELVTNEYSIGDYVLTGGDLAALVMIDSIVRLIPGVLNKSESAETDSHSDPLLDHPHYTRPKEFRGIKVPEILLSGHHSNIYKWRQKKRLEKTIVRRPDIVKEKN